MIWPILSIVLFIICIYLSFRVYNLRKSLNKILKDLVVLESKIPVLKP